MSNYRAHARIIPWPKVAIPHSNIEYSLPLRATVLPRGDKNGTARYSDGRGSYQSNWRDRYWQNVGPLNVDELAIGERRAIPLVKFDDEQLRTMLSTS